MTTRGTFWRSIFTVTGGLTVTGPRPSGGCVVVANHSSHADAAAIVAALGPKARPSVAAAQDYWFADRLHAATARTLLGAFPVRRNGGGTADLMGMTQTLRDGGTVVIFPEGTRSRDGVIAPFRSGAFRLAEAAGVPVVPAAISGTARLLPVHGLPRPTGLSVSFGEPLHANAGCPDEARTVVASMVSPGLAAPDSALRRRVAAFADSRHALVLALLWGVAEAVAWPLLPELLLAILIKASPRSAGRLAAAAIAGSVVGVGLTWLLCRHGIVPLQPLTTPRMHAFAEQALVEDGPSGIWTQPFSGVPIKVYAASAGSLGLPLPAVLFVTACARGLRIALGAVVMSLLSRVMRRTAFLYPLYLAVLIPGFLLGLGAAVSRWS